LHQRKWAGGWWFVWVRIAELLRGCCAESPEHRGAKRNCSSMFVSPTVGATQVAGKGDRLA
jgi:hypothetical protein